MFLMLLSQGDHTGIAFVLVSVCVSVGGWVGGCIDNIPVAKRKKEVGKLNHR